MPVAPASLSEQKRLGRLVSSPRQLCQREELAGGCAWDSEVGFDYGPAAVCCVDGAAWLSEAETPS